MKTMDVLDDVLLERIRQDMKWGKQDYPDLSGSRFYPWTLEERANKARVRVDKASQEGNLDWILILDEEVFEAYAEASAGDQKKLREELVQVAAVAVAWIEAIDRRKNEN